MIAAISFAALTVRAAPDAGCLGEDDLIARLGALGITLSPHEDVRVRFGVEEGKRIAEVEVAGAAPRRIEHEGPDCTTLSEATVALLSVLLDERERLPPEPPPSPPPSRGVRSRFRGEAGLVVSSGMVAPVAAGATLGFAWRPAPWGALGLVLETWPEREHSVRMGAVAVGASSAAIAGCVGRLWRSASLDACALWHTGIYALSADGFPVVRSQERVLFGAEAHLRGAVSIVEGLGAFFRIGLWAPVTRLDVAVRGAESGFVTTSLGLKGAVGLELR